MCKKCIDFLLPEKITVTSESNLRVDLQIWIKATQKKKNNNFKTSSE